MADLPPNADFTGSGVTEGGFKTALNSMLTYLRDILGSTGTPASARSALGLGALATRNDVTATEVATGAVTEPKIAAGAVTAGKIADGAVTEAKIGSGAVTASKLGGPMPFVLKAGDTMTGALVLAGNPTSDLAAAPKQYVDAATGRGVSPLIATTSGTAIDVTGIPSWATEVSVMLNGVRSNGSALRVQLGTASGIVTTGYQSATSDSGYSTVGLEFYGSPVYGINGVMTFKLVSAASNVWVAQGTVMMASSGVPAIAVTGAVTLSAPLTQLRLLAVGGPFVGGSCSVEWRR